MLYLRLTLLYFIVMLAILPDLAVCEDKVVDRPWEYRLGEGLRISDSNFHLGGYANIKYEGMDGNGRLVFDDLSLFLFGDLTERLRFFSEIEEAGLAEINTNGRSKTRDNLDIERLYLDYLSSDKLNVRIGKFLTPVGTWNEIHANPLTWTTSRPLVTVSPFPQFITGVQLFGNLTVMDEELAYSIFLQENEGLDEETGFRKPHSIYGSRLRWMGSRLQVGVPFLYYKEDGIEERVYMSGLDFTYKTSRLEIRGEGIYSGIDAKDNGWSREYGYYLQGVYGLTERHFLVLRQEYFKGRWDEGEHSAVTLGGVYKLRPQIVLKAEYQVRNGSLRINEASDGERFLASFSVLF